jgi:transcriptional regulator with XRE-family HTH domain
MEIRVAMTRADIRQSELARRIGKTEQWLSVRLRGKQPIDLNDLALIASGLGISFQALLPGAEVAAGVINNPKVVSGQISRSAAPAPKAHPVRSRQRPTGRTTREERRPRQVRTPGHTIPSRSAA